MFRAAIPLGMLYFLNYGQWELLTLFVTALGPAEMVTWAILGYLWSTLKYFSDGILVIVNCGSLLFVNLSL